MIRPRRGRHRALACTAAFTALVPMLAACGASGSGGGGSTVTVSTGAASTPATTQTSTSSTTGTAASTSTGSSLPSGTGTGTVPAPAPGGTSTSTTGVTTVINIDASASELTFVPDTVTAPAGRIILRMTNLSQLQHSVALAVPDGPAGAVVGYGGVSQFVATLAPGTYVFYDTVPGHRQAGMTGTLTVR